MDSINRYVPRPFVGYIRRVSSQSILRTNTGVDRVRAEGSVNVRRVPPPLSICRDRDTILVLTDDGFPRLFRKHDTYDASYGNNNNGIYRAARLPLTRARFTL